MQSALIEIARKLGCPANMDPLQWAAERLEEYFEALPLMREIARLCDEGSYGDMEHAAAEMGEFVEALAY